MTNILQIALSSKLSDKDDLKKITLSSDDAKAYIYLKNDNYIYQNDNENTIINDIDIVNKIEELIKKGFKSIVCEFYSGDMYIEIPSGKNTKPKITYSKPLIMPETTESGTIIDPDEASDLLKAIEIINPDGSSKADMTRKFIQIDNFIKIILPLLNKSSQNKKIFILDCGSGKSYLSFVMNYFLREKIRRNCHFYCIDTNVELIEKCKEIQKNLNYNNMEFYVSAIKDFQPNGEIDIVCSLHACDTATDEAIAKAITLNAPFLLVVPCCQHEVTNQLADHPLKAITRHGVYKSKLADLLTDGMRTLILEAFGYKVSITEYVSPIYTPKNILIQAEKIQAKNNMALKQYLELKKMFGGISIELERILQNTFDF
ncbi:MAG: class I SAM-dependent methyltransferase [Candidatus Poribacteria bacterium]